MRHYYESELKIEVCKKAQEGTPTRELSKEYNIPGEYIRRWRQASRRHPENPFPGQGVARNKPDDKRFLKRRIRELEETNASLQKVVLLLGRTLK